MKKLPTIFSSLLFAFCFLVLLPTSALAFPTAVNYQGRAFDANNKFVGDGCYPVSIKIGRFSDEVKAPIGSGSYGQPGPGVESVLRSDRVLNTHPTNRCPQGQAYVSNGLFNVILNLEGFDASFMASTLPFYGISINFDNKGWSLWQPFVQDGWVYPNNQKSSPQTAYYLYSHQDPSGSWGLATNHGFWAQGGLGAPALWLIGGDYSASRLTVSAGGPGAGWYSTIDSTNTAVGATPAGATPLKLNPSKGNVEIGNNLCLGGVCRNSWGPKIASGISSDCSPADCTITDAYRNVDIKIDYSSAGFTSLPTISCTPDKKGIQQGAYDNNGGVACEIMREYDYTTQHAWVKIHGNSGTVRAHWIAIQN